MILLAVESCFGWACLWGLAKIEEEMEKRRGGEKGVGSDIGG